MRRLAPVKRLTREQFLDRDPTLLSLIFRNPKKEIRKKNCLQYLISRILLQSVYTLNILSIFFIINSRYLKNLG